MRNDTGFVVVRWIVKRQRHKALARARLQIFEHALVARIIRQDQQKILVGVENDAAFFYRENTSMIRQRMNQHGRVLTRLDDFVQIAHGSSAHGARQRSIDPHGFLTCQQVAPDQITGAQILMTGHRNQRRVHCQARLGSVFRLAVEHIGHVFHETRLTTPGWPFEQHREPGGVGSEKHLDFIGEREIVRRLLQGMRFNGSDGELGSSLRRIRWTHARHPSMR